MVNVLDCDIVKRELKLQSYSYFQTNMLEKGIPYAMGNIVPLLFFYKDGFGIK